MVYRLYVEKKQGLTLEAGALKKDIRSLLGIKSLQTLRIINRYDVENISEELFSRCIKTVFSEPQLDIVENNITSNNTDTVFAVEYLPGQFDQRADSAAQCVQIISQGDRPLIRTAKVYILSGSLTDNEILQIKKYVINPVEAREASLAQYETLKVEYEVPADVAVLDGFSQLDETGLTEFIKNYSLAMDLDDIKFCRAYFQSEERDPTITEIRMIDTYWSDHCRHTTFLTTIDSVEFEDKLIGKAYDEYIAIRKEIGRTKPINLMDIATIGARYLSKQGKLQNLDESEEINACTVKIEVEIEGKKEKWLLLFKNETHNHPTEIEPFGGAATCIGGAIRDPLSGRAFVYGAMRVTGAGNPQTPVSETLKGKLPQRKIVRTAAAGNSSYGNQIGLATGQVDEIYHDGYVAKHMEIGAVIAAAPAENVRRELPLPGDKVILLGGRTGRDGCGGATGSSKSHNLSSLESCGAEVQKGNAPEERKLQRLFRNKEASLLIKRCNDFGAGGVSVAIGELADGLYIDLDAVPKKYNGLDGTELAISESQERMAVVVSPFDVEKFRQLANSENLETSVVATVTEEARLVMTWNNKTIVNLSREFLNSNGAEKHISVSASAPKEFKKATPKDFKTQMLSMAKDLNVCSKRGLSERFDSTVGTGTVLMPFGGIHQRTPILSMVHKISVEDKHTDTCSYMSWGFNPFISQASPYHGAYLAVVESVCKLVATGAEFSDVYLTFQEYFEKPYRDSKRWGKPFSALLGAFMAQKDYGIAAIGGKDSMSGSFEDIDVPPTLVSFAVTTGNSDDVISPEFKAKGHKVLLFVPQYDENNLPVASSVKKIFNTVNKLITSKKALAVSTPSYGGVAEALMKMTFGNEIGIEIDKNISLDDLFSYKYGAFIVEMCEDVLVENSLILGTTAENKSLKYKNSEINLSELLNEYESTLENIYHCNITNEVRNIPAFTYKASSYPTPRIKSQKPKVLIPVFPGTNCEYDSAKAISAQGAEAEMIVINNLTADGISKSVEYFAKQLKNAQMVFIPGGFSGGDEPDGSAKFITAFFRNGAIYEQVEKLLSNRDGLILGICNGFQALIKLGLVPYGRIIDTDENSPTLTYNTIGRHQSKLVRTKVASNKSPWLMETQVGEIYTVPVSHGEGRFIIDPAQAMALAENGQIATQYVDLSGKPTNDVQYNPNDSYFAIEGITSPDGRVFGKMGHSERIGHNLYKNVDGIYDMGLFKSAVKYFKI